MTNPLLLFGADGRMDERVLRIGPWAVGVVDKTGSDPPSYVAWVERADGLCHPPDRATPMDPGCRLFLGRDPLIQKEPA
jgi:hypothetical protein